METIKSKPNQESGNRKWEMGKRKHERGKRDNG